MEGIDQFEQSFIVGQYECCLLYTSEPAQRGTEEHCDPDSRNDPRHRGDVYKRQMQGYPCADASAGARIRGAAEHSPSAPRSECIIIAAKPRLATTFSQKAPCGTPKRSGTVRASSKAAGTHAAHDGPQTVGQPRCDPLPRNPGKALAPTILDRKSVV